MTAVISRFEPDLARKSAVAAGIERVQQVAGDATGKKLSVIVPCFNEEEAIPVFLEAVRKQLLDLRILTGLDHEFVFVDDGSCDRTRDVLAAEAARDSRLRVIALSRNFGKEAALTAGFEYACGDAVVAMDVDLQDPPHLLPAMVALWLQGYPVVQAVRSSRHEDSGLKRITASCFYRLMRRLSDVPFERNVGDFQLLSRRAVDALLRYPERTRFMKGLTAAIGFQRARVQYQRPRRATGETKFNYWRLWNFALDGITAFSTLPLRVWTYVGATVAGAAFCFAMWIVARTLIYGVVTPGYATTMVLLLFLGGLQLIGLGVVGEYVGRIAAEVRNRPLYHVEQLIGAGNQGARP